MTQPTPPKPGRRVRLLALFASSALLLVGAGVVGALALDDDDDEPTWADIAATSDATTADSAGDERPADETDLDATTRSAAGEGQPEVDAGGLPSGEWVNITPPAPASFAFVEFQNYGAQIIAVAPSDPSVVYLGSCLQGIFRTTDGGATWIKTNTGPGGDVLDTGRNWTLAVDPTDADTLYTVAGYGSQGGLWRSTDGGVSWEQIIDPELLEQVQYGGHVSHVSIEPTDGLHLLVGFHDPFLEGPASIAETRDGGRTWERVTTPAGWGGGVFPFFLSSETWLVASEGDGVWRTTDAGGSWTKVSDTGIWHGSTQLYRASTGDLYLGALGTLLKSNDDGETWREVGPDGGGGFHAVVGNGRYLFAQRSWTGEELTYYVSPEADGENWEPLDESQTFVDGPMSMAVDRVAGVVYSSNWNGGVWKLDY